eukprot:scaffold32623_cov36-Cyclotella_meneghiniana.AAC.1
MSPSGVIIAELSRAGDGGKGIFWMVPRWGDPLIKTFTRVPGGNGSGAGSVLCDRSPHTRPPSK